MKVGSFLSNVCVIGQTMGALPPTHYPSPPLSKLSRSKSFLFHYQADGHVFERLFCGFGGKRGADKLNTAA